MIRPKHTLESVVRGLVQGLEDGTVELATASAGEGRPALHLPDLPGSQTSPPGSDEVARRSLLAILEQTRKNLAEIEANLQGAEELLRRHALSDPQTREGMVRFQTRVSEVLGRTLTDVAAVAVHTVYLSRTPGRTDAALGETAS